MPCLSLRVGLSLCGIAALLIAACLLPVERLPAPRLLSGRNSWSPPPVIYGHVHMAKTGGTSLNGELALRFERVCGHKGYSFDYAHVNDNPKSRKKDLVGRSHNGYSRGRVPAVVMEERGSKIAITSLWRVVGNSGQSIFAIGGRL